MSDIASKAHWENVYETKAENEVSWFQEMPDISLELIASTGAGHSSSIVDVGGGASRLVDALIAEGYADVTVLDISKAALSVARERLGKMATKATWIVADVTQWRPNRYYDLWHDRAAFHFLTEAADRSAYAACLRNALKPDGCAIIGTFALDGPERCSGLPVIRHDAHSIAAMLGPSFRLLQQRRHVHQTPTGKIQNFQFSVFRRD